jgi:hypothetical protein
MDRGYAKFALFNAIVKHGSSYVCRLRDNSVDEVVEARPLTDADRQANVLSPPRRIRIGLSGKAAHRPDHPDGIKIQTYPAIIACLLINLWTGRQPSKRTHEMLCYYLMGWADEEELLAHLAKLKARDAVEQRQLRGRGVGVRVAFCCAELSAVTLINRSPLA